ncbi:thrombospondin type 3 repeat-containing protein [Vibrio superstes]|uniref:Thrombospondin type 3 repeat-containing protein n=1 Tax=Vibrio superstes NBRC 103154 TaxID=1219062 RepID=A0A511QN57_9VIBR|nr:thrombospondin type 3 repeat-containing protein [Vibrio superstes]GEM77962.1 hypothetical protein VSU01S_02070 [Vibrio superstes NBRC 103154]
MNKKILALAISSCFLAGCSDDGSSQSTANTEMLEVKAIDGYLRNALVWLDINQNGVFDEEEPSIKSGEGGVALLDVSGVDNYQDYPVIVSAIKGETIDEDAPDTTINYDFVLSAPAGETNITPFTTIVKIEMDTTGKTKEESISEVSEMLGVPQDKVMSDYSEIPEVANKARNLVATGVIPETVEEANEIAETENYLAQNTEVMEIAEVIKDLEPDEVIITDGTEYKAIEDSDDDDRDNDGFLDDNDAFPSDSSEWLDSDEDGIGDNADAFPTNPYEAIDTDGDGVGDNADAFPEDPSETLDTDGDSVGDNADAFPEDPTEALDTDGDSVGDNADIFPEDPTEALDTDGDSVGDNADAFPEDPSETHDTDGDQVGDNADAFPLDPYETVDSDSDGEGDNTDIDDDNDTISDATDNCPFLPNAQQKDYDSDGIGDACDSETLATFGTARFDSDKWL